MEGHNSDERCSVAQILQGCFSWRTRSRYGGVLLSYSFWVGIGGNGRGERRVDNGAEGAGGEGDVEFLDWEHIRFIIFPMSFN